MFAMEEKLLKIKIFIRHRSLKYALHMKIGNFLLTKNSHMNQVKNTYLYWRHTI